MDTLIRSIVAREVEQVIYPGFLFFSDFSSIFLSLVKTFLCIKKGYHLSALSFELPDTNLKCGSH